MTYTLVVTVILIVMTAAVLSVLISTRHKVRENTEILTQEHARQLAEKEAEYLRDQSFWKNYADTVLREKKSKIDKPTWQARGKVIDALSALNISGVLLTDIDIPTVSQQGDPYFTQIDFLLLTDRYALVIEAKNFKGIIYHKQKMSKDCAHLVSFAGIAGDTTNYVIHINPPSDGSDRIDASGLTKLEQSTTFVYSGKKLPDRQVQRHATVLKEFLDDGYPHWIYTSVLYCHDGGLVYRDKNPLSLNALDKTTRILASAEELGTLAEKMYRNVRHSSDYLAVADALRPYAADQVGFGEASEKYGDRFSAQVMY